MAGAYPGLLEPDEVKMKTKRAHVIAKTQHATLRSSTGTT
jgi:hypothetical protein